MLALHVFADGSDSSAKGSQSVEDSIAELESFLVSDQLSYSIIQKE